MGFRSTTARTALFCALFVASATPATTAFAQQPPSNPGGPSADEIKAARELFTEAFKDEQEKRYGEALEKFQRVAKVKESPSVRYRIATVLVALGRLREARDMFRALAASKSSLPPADQDIADSGAEKAAELDRRIPKLALRVQDNPPPDLRVTVDGAPVPVSTTPRSIELDPGEHAIAASGRGNVQTEQTVMLVEGGSEVSHTVTFAPETTKPPPSNKTDHTLAWIAVGGGATLLVTGTILLIAREGAISDIEANCPVRVCPTSKREDVESAQDRAELFGPLGGVLAVVGVAAIGVGVWMLVRPSSKPNASQTALSSQWIMPSRNGAKLGLSF